ncbi:MAG: hypothetical protein GX555_03660 [Actinomycetales bacterium]|nr:hypothetical protein [Actinomycetales bacterium]
MLVACSDPAEKGASETASAALPADQAPQEATAGEHDASSSHQKTLDDFAAMAGIADPPPVDRIRIVTLDEWASVRVDCLNEAGFPAYIDETGAVGMDFASPDQTSAYDLAVYVCMAQYPLDPRHSEELSADQLAIYYDWLLEHPVTCMRERGHPVADPPTLPTFIENYRATGEVNFFADALPPGQEAEIMSDVLQHCETEPPLEVLFDR